MKSFASVDAWDGEVGQRCCCSYRKAWAPRRLCVCSQSILIYMSSLDIGHGTNDHDICSITPPSDFVLSENKVVAAEQK